MSWRVIFRPNAEADLREAWAWYATQRPGLSDELLIEIRTSVRRLESNPGRQPFYYHEFRRLLTRRLFYKLC